MSRVATIQRVKSVSPITGADKVELIKFEDVAWQCVSQKGNFKPGDLAIYIEVDSIIKESPQFEFLRPHNFKIKPIRLRGILSEGLALPLQDFNMVDKNHTGSVVSDFSIIFVQQGEDVSEHIGAEHYEKPIAPELAGIAIGNFPTVLCRKTDEERIEKYPLLLEECKDKDIYISTKIDGSSVTYIKHDGKFRVCTRNLELERCDNTLWKLAAKYKLEEQIPDGFALQAEVAGPGIQKNSAGLKEHSLFFFNAYSITERRYADYNEFVYFCNSRQLPTCPLVYIGPFKFQTVEDLLNFANQQKYSNGKQAEGVVIRPLKEFRSSALGGRASFKVIASNYKE
jgi:RNA ligase (TIGR02306 family)